MMASKRQPAFRDLVATDHFLRLAAHAYEFRLTRHGLFLKVGQLTPLPSPLRRTVREAPPRPAGDSSTPLHLPRCSQTTSGSPPPPGPRDLAVPRQPSPPPPPPPPQVGEGGKMHTWYSGRFPAAHMLARSSDLAATSLALFRLGKSKAPAALEEAGRTCAHAHVHMHMHMHMQNTVVYWDYDDRFKPSTL